MTMNQNGTVLPTVATTKVIKRYANRKLYDTEESKYITLGEIATFIKAGREVQVVDNVSKTDITGQTLLTALVETDADIGGQTETLRAMLMAGGLGKYVSALKATKPSTP